MRQSNPSDKYSQIKQKYTGTPNTTVPTGYLSYIVHISLTPPDKHPSQQTAQVQTKLPWPASAGVIGKAWK